MEITDKRIDDGKLFDWGKVSKDYAKYRDIYPKEFYKRIIDQKLCIDGQRILDLGTGTGVLPRNMVKYGAKWIGTDISREQITQAKLLSIGMDIDYYNLAAEDIDFPDHSFDLITACQCFWYFDHKRILPNLVRMLKPHGRILILYMAWLPHEDKIAGASENLVLKYNPKWSGAGEYIHPISIPECYLSAFDLLYHEEYLLTIPFTRESWHGCMKASRGVGASLKENEVTLWEKEHCKLLTKIAPDEFEVLHYAAMAVLEKK